MKRKLATGMLAMMLAVSMVMPVAAAAEKPENQNGTLTLNATKGSAYQLSIPATPQTIVYNQENTGLGSLKVTGNVSVGESVTVSVETHAFQRTGSTNDTIAFKLMDSATAKEYVATTWNEEDLRATEAKVVPLSVNIAKADWDAAKSGSYSGSIVFTATFNEATPQ